jgi:FkbM family methyltransferase
MKETIKYILYRLIGKRRIHYLYNLILGRKAPFSEAALIYDYFGAKKITGTLVDVGAHFGESFEPYLDRNWKVLAFEPDKTKWDFLNKFRQNKNLTLLTQAVSNKSSINVPFYVSTESTGISSLSPFVESHKEAGGVDLVTLRDTLSDYNISNVTFLKIDTEGHDLFVLEGFPWDMMTPDVILCEFEDLKTKRLGYSYKDLGEFLIQKGYTVYLSEWYPVVKYGGDHKWRNIVKYPAVLANVNAWGNFIAVSTGEAKDYFDKHLGDRK